MIDDDDVFSWIVLFPVLGPVTLVIFAVGVIALSVVSCENEKDCAARPCKTGSGKVIKGECLCVEAAPTK